MSEPTASELNEAQRVLDAQNIPRPHYACTTSGWYKFNRDGSIERGEFTSKGKWRKSNG